MSLSPVQQTAYNDIQSRLSESWYSDVGRGDMTAVRETLQGLGAADADAVIDAMQGSGLLSRMADEANDSRFLGMGQGGFSTEERQALFGDLASKLDGQSLAAVSNAFAGVEEREADFNVVTEMGQAVADRASPQAKLDYIDALKADVGGSGISTTLYGGGFSAATLTRHVDSEAGAIGTVLSSLSGPYAAAAFTRLDDAQLAAVLKTGVDQNESNAGTGGGSTFNSARFEGVVRAASTVAGPDAIAIRARVFEAAGERLAAVDDAGKGLGFYADSDASLKGMTGAMTQLLNTDTNGIMRQLTFDGATAGGSGMTHYAEAMIRTGQNEALADIVVDLQFGNAHNENAVERLDQEFRTPGGEVIRENAGALGYFLGAVYAGAADHTSDVRAQQEEITGLLNFVAGKIPVAGGFSVGDAALGQDSIKKAVEMAINAPGSAPAQRLELAAMPRDANGRQIAGDDITTVFRTQLEAVRRAQEE